jgi:DNA polymerase epsilon subunit 2
MTADSSTPSKLSPRKQKQSKPLGDAFFGAKGITKSGLSNPLPSSSPAFGTPVHPTKPFSVPFNIVAPSKSAILPILLPPATLRPLAFRTFTKKHSLTITSTALQELATFIGRHCGSGWREEGLAEKVLEEVAKSWKNRNGGVIVDGASKELKEILKMLEGNMSGGKIMTGARGISRQNSLMLEPSNDTHHSNTRLGLRPTTSLTREDSQSSMGMSSLAVEEEPDEEVFNNPRRWLTMVGAFDQPRMLYNVAKKHFEKLVQETFEGIHRLISVTETLQNRRYCRRHHTKLQSSETGSTLYIKGFFETSLSKPRPLRNHEGHH